MPSLRRPTSRIASSLLMFSVVSVVCGLLVAGLVMPFIGAAAYGSKAAVGQLNNLPVEFAPPAQSQRSKILDANGDVLAYFYDENRVYVGLDKIAPVMRQAIVAIEDHRFYEHGPIDATGTLRAFLRNQAAGGVTQGGSSITQQYVKMVQVEAAKQRGDDQGVKDAQAGTYSRKIEELRYAISLERNLSKDQILERYLNIAYFGNGTYGIQAAAEYYFDTTAAKLTLPQAAMLAGLVQNPNVVNPVSDKAAALDRRDVVLNRMSEVGVVSLAAAAKAKKQGFDAKDVQTTRNGCLGTEYPFLCDYTYKTLAQTPSLGATVAERENAIKRGGLTITTGIDPETQDVAQKAVSKVVGPTDPLISAMDMVQPGTGLIVAMAQSRPDMGSNEKLGETFWNYSVSPDFGGAQGFQAGSTFKAFTAAAALAEGTPLAQRYNARQTMDFANASYESCSGQQQVTGDFTVSNSTGTNGVMDMNRAAQRSVNTYFVQLELDTGMCPVVEMAEKLGVESSTKSAPISSYDDKPSFTLGTVEVNPLSMAEAYATFAAGGIHCKPVIVDTIKDSTGKELAAPDADCKRVMTEDVANAVNSMLASVITQGTGGRAATADGRPQAGKTGTIDSNKAVWFVGYTPEVAGAAMISVDNTRAPFTTDSANYRSRGLKGYVVPSTGLLLEGSGSGDAGQEIWKPVMQKYLADKPKTAFTPPSAELAQGNQTTTGNQYGNGQDPFGNGQQYDQAVPGDRQRENGPR
ncbi:MAG TPA: transglycosylase domain-containing protein [Propionibacteriaceae bacterium]